MTDREIFTNLKIIITNCEKKVIKKCDRNNKVRQEVIKKCDKNLLQSGTGNTKCGS